MKRTPRLIRITTVPVSLLLLLKGQMNYMRQNGFEVIMISSPGAEAQQAEEQEMCEMITIPMERGVHLLKDVVTLFRLYRLLKRLKPDIVHTHTPKAGLLGMLASRLCAVPVRMHTIAGLPWMEHSGLSRFVLKQMERLTAICAHRIYPNSVGLKKIIESECITSSKKIKLVGEGSSNGIDCSYFNKAVVPAEQLQQVRIKAGVPENGFVWIFVGRLVKDKGIAELVKVFLQMVQEFPEDQLWLVGKEEPELDPLSTQTRNYIQQHPAIKCWGFQSDVRPFLAASSALVFPSYREGFPNVPMQAGAMQLPMIVSDINGCNELVQHGVTGMLVPPKTEEPLFHAMRLLRRDAELRNRLAFNSREQIVAKYHQQTIWENLRGEYYSLLKEKEK